MELNLIFAEQTWLSLDPTLLLRLSILERPRFLFPPPPLPSWEMDSAVNVFFSTSSQRFDPDLRPPPVSLREEATPLASCCATLTFRSPAFCKNISVLQVSMIFTSRVAARSSRGFRCCSCWGDDFLGKIRCCSCWGDDFLFLCLQIEIILVGKTIYNIHQPSSTLATFWVNKKAWVRRLT